MLEINQITLNTKELENQLNDFRDRLMIWFKEIREHPVINPNLDKLIDAFKEDRLNQTGIGLTNAVNEFIKRIIPGLANTAGPRAFPWVLGGVTPAALVGAIYQIMYDQINMVSGASIAPKFETETIHLLLDLMNLSRKEFVGTLTTGATASNLCALASARQWCGEQSGLNISQEGIYSSSKIEVYSASPHASIGKSLSVIGMGRHIIPVATLSNREAIDVSALETLLKKATQKAKIIVASAGTVNTGDFDNLKDVAALCQRYNAWLHVDGAFGLFARCTDQYAALVSGVELADSITCDGHKWLNVPYDCGILFVRKKHKRLLIATFSTVADYMGTASDEPMNKGVENSRALRALPVWMTLKAYGQSGYNELVVRNCQFAQEIGKLISSGKDYQLITPVKLNIVLFKGIDIDTTEKNTNLIKQINATGKIFITPSSYNKKPALRIAVCNWQTTLADDLNSVYTALKEGMTNYKKNNYS
ncbi:MAG TPA: aminotransferase class I/II-fold pyridoxal phosphate-dependent enzyme [Rhabdochlamydiaceae bacterium]|nr:aminotransferase class I/II-fold pyridoxal phosphate-dependent enzyme [Rhabdochlamydiaceae bacterium]